MTAALDAAPGCADTVTLMTSRGPLATKRVSRADTEGYGKAKRFRISEAGVANIDELAAVLEAVGPQPLTFVIRGRPVEGLDRDNALRRLYPRTVDGTVEPATLESAARQWVLLDIDSLPCPRWLDPLDDPDHCVEYTVSHLPAEFHDATVWWQFTRGQGIEPGIRIRLGFWLDRKLTDAQLLQWLSDAPVDKAVFRPAQPIYVAHPIFDGVPDPVPYRSGIWRGDRDAVTAPVLAETPQAAATEWVPPVPTVGGIEGLFAYARRGGYANHRSRIGDHEGGLGFYQPIQSAVGSYFRQFGAECDANWLLADLETAIRAAPRDPAKHSDAYVEKRIRDLVPLIVWVGQQEAARAERQSAIGTLPEPDPVEPPVEPTYPPPLGSAAEARAVLAERVRSFTQVSSLYQHETQPPPVAGVSAAIGTGKSQTTREELAEPLVAQGKPVTVAVPQHRLGDEYVRELVGSTGRVYRGRDAADPDAPGGEKMCREYERAAAIFNALGDVEQLACKSRDGKHECEFYNVCGYRKQRQAKPQIWVVAHSLLAHPRPEFIPAPAALVIDEAFDNAFLHGVDKPVWLDLSALKGDRTIPGNVSSTADLESVSSRVYAALMASEDGWVTRGLLLKARFKTNDLLRNAHKLEWRRKLDLAAVLPGMPRGDALGHCKRVAKHNGKVSRLARFWKLLADLLDGEQERSPYLHFKQKAPLGDDDIGPGVRMVWRSDIDESWKAPTLLLDATLQPEVARVFFPQMGEPVLIDAPMPYTRVRQITDQPLSHAKFIPTEKAGNRRNASRRNNVERLRRLIEVRAADVSPGRGVVITQQDIEKALKAGPLPENIEVTHYNSIRGLNQWSNVALLMVVGRTEPSAQAVELAARALFGVDIEEVEAGPGGIQYPQVTRAIRMRDGTGCPVIGNRHPDPRAEAVRFSICEAEVVQAIGRGRGVNRTAENPLQIDVLNNVCLPGIEVDEVTTWEAIQPGYVDIMRAHGAVPLTYADMAAAYPDLFSNGHAAQMALIRGNPSQTSIEEYLIDKCDGFRRCEYRKRGSRGPHGRLLHHPDRIEPARWLAERLGDVTVLPQPPAAELSDELVEELPPAVEEQLDTAPQPPAARPCESYVPTEDRNGCGTAASRPCPARQWCYPPADDRGESNTHQGGARTWQAILFSR